jgi:hypothetical protein
MLAPLQLQLPATRVAIATAPTTVIETILRFLCMSAAPLVVPTAQEARGLAKTPA